MQRIILANKEISYEIKPSRRSRRLGLTVHPGGRLVVTAPRLFGLAIEPFIRRNAAWVLRTISRLEGKVRLPGGLKDYRANRAKAQVLISERVRYFNAHYHFPVGRITVKDTRSRWGSCSRKGNLNFSYKLVHMSPELLDYVVVHEICHLGEFNHSKKFWALVGETIPHYKKLRSELKSFVH